MYSPAGAVYSIWYILYSIHVAEPCSDYVKEEEEEEMKLDLRVLENGQSECPKICILEKLNSVLCLNGFLSGEINIILFCARTD